jgi:flagellar hook-basal body complex protein FliE
MDLLSAMRSAADPMLRNAMWQDARAQAESPLKTAGAAGLTGAPGLTPATPGTGTGTGIGDTSGVGGGLSGVGGLQRGRSFDSLLGEFVSEVNAKQVASSDATRALLGGEKIPLHRVMIAAEEASVSFQLMVEVRNKVLESYQELMRMQI